MQLTEEELTLQEYNEGFWCWYWSNFLDVLGRDKSIEEHRADYAEHLKNKKESEDYRANSSLSVVTVIEGNGQESGSSGSENDDETAAEMSQESESSQEVSEENFRSLKSSVKEEEEEVKKKSIGIPASLNPEMWESDSD
ncbi:Protein CBG26513 [Caenorhabditis briggsae]|uniref:Uncharacterized protein n=2 Tax=Caenorhabditis briggsae TaxID=6238 RepID=A0AAE9AHS5_CAEBR|nr:Protein CBG26513 [Caenorhabditis briggsae]ULT97747.1 hypothetical protein L3Y34_005523 [Caenorhabditis briggsae]CAR99876.1 Protein CBG26513 [Caenorhabditis briggsae]